MNEARIEYLDDDAAAQTAFSDAHDQLADPAGIAARAMQRAQEADNLHDEIATADPLKLAQLNGQQRSALGVAAILAQVAELAIHLQQHKIAVTPQTVAEDRPEPLHPDGPDDERPQPLSCTFTAELYGDSFLIGDTEMLFVPGNGWIDVTDFERVDSTGADPITWRLSGRARSMYRERVLVSTPNGAAMVLPAALVTLEADE